MNDFKSLGIHPTLLQAVEALGFEQPTEVQQQTIPILLNKDTDIVSLAQTGTGKTAAFGLPMLQKIDAKSRITQGIVISPTRELCLQISKELTKYASQIKGLNIVPIYGGASINDQARAVKKGAQILVATPGRMQDMIRRRIIDISSIAYCVLDEADEMLNMGFKEDITNILSHTPNDKSTWLFSATMPKEVARIAKNFMHNPIEITVGTKNSAATNINHEYYVVAGRERYNALKKLSDTHPDIFSIVFCRTKRDTQKIAEKLKTSVEFAKQSFPIKDTEFNVFSDYMVCLGIAKLIFYPNKDEIKSFTHKKKGFFNRFYSLFLK